MLFFLNLDGTVTRSDTDHVYQGQNKVANVELFTLISPAQAAIQVAFTLPNGLTTTYAPMSYVGAYSVDKSNQKQVHHWKLAVPYNVTEVEGQVGVSFNVVLNDGTSGQTQETINQTTYTSSFLVEYSALPIPPTTATEGELEQILTLLNLYYTQNASLAAKQPFVVGTVNTNTLGANQQASVAVEQSAAADSNGNYPTNFDFGIPQGTTFTPSVDDNGNISWSNDGGKANPVTKNIKGAQGQTGATPDIEMQATVDANVGTPSVAVEKSGTAENPKFTLAFSNIKGENGEQGVGVKSITSGTPTVVNDKTNTPITITLTDNTTVDLVVSAENGKDGTSATPDIVQATGQSTTAVMSQKAVTDELNKKANTSDIPTKYVVSVNGESGEVKNIAKTNSANTFTGDQTVTGNGSVSGNFTVGGNLTVNGTTTTVDSTTLQVKDKLIEVAHGNTKKLTSPAGIVAPKYDGTNSGALVFNGDGIASVGDVVLDASGNIDVTQSNLQPLATRTGLVNDNLVKYDGTNQTLVDTGKKISDFATVAQVNAKQNALTETQLAAVDSGITEAKRTKYDGYEEIINQKANSADLATVATSGSYNNLSNIPVINQDLTNFMPVGGTYYRHIGASSDTFRNNTIYLYDGSHYISLRDIPTLQSSVVGLQQQVNNLQGQISSNESGSVSVILASSDWVADSTIAPFTVKATKTLSSETGGAVVMGQFDMVSLAYFTAEAKKARSAGVCIGEVPQASGSEITFYAVTAPTEQIQAIVIISPTTIQD